MLFFKKDRNRKDLVLLCDRCREHLVNMLAKEDFGGSAVHFTNIVKNWNIAQCGMRIVKSYKGDGIFVLEIYATFPDGSGYEMKNFLIHGTVGELTAYLSDSALTENMIESYSQFSEGIADKL